MEARVNPGKILDADQTKAFLKVIDNLPNRLLELEKVRLCPRESCRAMLSYFVYAWSIAEASRLPVAAELAEVGIIEMSARLGLKVRFENRAMQWYSGTKPSR